MAIIWTTDNMAQVRNVIRKAKLRIDPQYAGECRWLAEDARVRKAYFSKRGVTLDGMTEILWSRGLTSQRMTCNELIDALPDLLAPATKRVSVKHQRAVAGELEAKIKRNRLRGYRCHDCRDVAYHSGFEWRGTCPCGGSYICRDAALMMQVAEVTDAVPF